MYRLARGVSQNGDSVTPARCERTSIGTKPPFRSLRFKSTVRVIDVENLQGLASVIVFVGDEAVGMRLGETKC